MNEACVKVRQRSPQRYRQRFDESFINGLIFLFYLPPHSPPYSIYIFLLSSIRRGTDGPGGGRSLLKITGRGFSLACWRQEICWRRDNSLMGIRHEQRHNQHGPGTRTLPGTKGSSDANSTFIWTEMA